MRKLVMMCREMITTNTISMKRFKVTYNYFDGGKKRIAIRILEALDRDHAIMLMAMWPKLILKVEQYESRSN
jgi:hypothetical protein